MTNSCSYSFAKVLLATGCLLASNSSLSHGDDPHSVTDSNADSPDHETLDEAPTLKQRSLMMARAANGGIGSNPNFRLTPDAQVAELGRWETPIEWPLVGVFNSLLSDGRVLSFDSAIYDGEKTVAAIEDFTRATVWNPITGYHSRSDARTGHNLFCSGFASLPDGRLFLAAGNLPGSTSIPQTHIFNPDTDSWMETQTMKHARWYPGVTPLPNGEMLITGGRVGESELREKDGTIRALTGLNQSYWRNADYPWLQTAPNGEVAFLGPHPQLGYASTEGLGAWRETSTRDNTYRSYGSYAMFDIGKVLITGGGFESGSHTQKSTRVVDLSDQSAVPSGDMNWRRRQHDVTILADGSVLASGGLSSNANLVDLQNAVYASEIWNPATGRWKTVASEASARLYHSSALLLPDGRVLSTGGGVCGDCTTASYHMTDAQIYTPPYLFEKDGSGNLANRPIINNAPKSLSYSQQFLVNTPQANSIVRAALIRNGSATHSQNSEQRYIPLAFSLSDSNTLVVQSPANPNIAPPGHYMLFLIDSTGVPSVSKIIQIENGNTLVEVSDLQNFAQDATVRQSSTYSTTTVASNAIDGNTNGNYSAASITHTQYENNPWLELDLRSVRNIDRIRLYNRTDCCSDRLSKFHVLLSTTPFVSPSLVDTMKQPGVREHYFDKPVGEVLEIDVDRSARYIRIQGAAGQILSLAEVQVWGKGTTVLTPNSLGSGQLPSGFQQIDFQMYDGNWIGNLNLPLTPSNGDSVSFSSQATFSAKLDTSATDYPLDVLLIRTNQRYEFTFDATSQRWLIGGNLVSRLSPRNTGPSIPDNPRPVTFYTLSDGNWTGSVILPRTANADDVVVFQNRATWSTRISGTHQEYNAIIELRQGENYAFQYSADCGCWRWIQSDSNILRYNVRDLSSGRIPALRKPYARVLAWNGNYQPKVFLPIPSARSAKVEIHSDAAWRFTLHGINNDDNRFIYVNRGDRMTFVVDGQGRWVRQ